MNFVDNGRTAKGSDPSAGGSDPFAVHIQNILILVVREAL